MKTKHFKQVDDFHKAYGMARGDVNVDADMNAMTKEDAEGIQLRFRLIQEEFKELMESQDPDNMIKELSDLVYVILGTFVAFGWDFDEAFNRVHESNMSKLGPDGKPVYREDGKVMKGPNYKPPYMGDLV
jgi:phosphoribosyl-ATP pyrophosphohydrolase